MPTHITIHATRLQCRHVFTDGHRCGSPCLRHEEFCYFHHTTRRPTTRRRSRHLRITPPEDRSAIQLAVGEIVQSLADNSLDPKRAALLLYALQIASSNLPRTAAQPLPAEPVATVEEISKHPRLGTLAPRAELPADKPGIADLLLDRWHQLNQDPSPDPTHTD